MVTLPALVLLFQRIWPYEPTPVDERRFAPGRWLADRLPANAVWIGLGTAAIALSSWSALHVSAVGFEENFNAIGEVEWPWQRARDPGSGEPTPATRARRDGRRLAGRIEATAIAVRRALAPDSFEPSVAAMSTRQRYESALQGQMSSVPTVLAFQEADTARRSFRTIERFFEEGRLDAFSSVSSIYSFLPGSLDQQKRRRAEMADIEALLEREDLSAIDEKLRRRIDELRGRLEAEPVTVGQLPTWTKKLFQEAGSRAKEPAAGEPFAYEYIIYLIPKYDQLNGPFARRMVEQLSVVRGAISGEVDLAADSEAYIDLIDEIQTRGVRLILIGLVVVFAILLVAFRHPVRALVSISSISFAGLLLLGILGWLGIRFDVFNIVFLTAIIGISVDDDVHLYRRYLDMGEGSIGGAVRWVGPAVAMNALTSGIGFGGLALTDNAGLRSIGYLAVVGVVCSLLSTLIMLPLVIKGVEMLSPGSGKESPTTDRGTGEAS
jgi:hypothetical protein